MGALCEIQIKSPKMKATPNPLVRGDGGAGKVKPWALKKKRGERGKPLGIVRRERGKALGGSREKRKPRGRSWVQEGLEALPRGTAAENTINSRKKYA
jgi:hypothetical protein